MKIKNEELYNNFKFSIFLFSLLITFSLFIFSKVSAQNNTLTVKTFEIKDGLSQNYVNAVLQDENGLIWIGTQDGLNKYDGYTFETFRRDASDSTKTKSLSSNYVNHLAYDKQGNIWIATQKGLNKLNPQNNTFTHFAHNEADPNSISRDQVYFVLVDKDENIWALTDSVLEKYNKNENKFEHFQIPIKSKKAISSYNNLSIVEYEHNGDSGLLIATVNGLMYFSFVTNNFSPPFRHSETNKNTISNNEVNTIYRDKKGTIWVGTQNGLNRFSAGKDFQRFYYKNNPNAEFENQIYSIIEDQTGMFWLGTGAGFKKLDLEKNQIIDVEHRSIEKFSGTVNQITEDFSGILWCSTKKGLLKIDNRIKKFNIINDFSYQDHVFTDDAQIFSIKQEKNGYTWVSSNGITLLDKQNNKVRKYCYLNKDFFLPEDIYYPILIDSKENIWTGSDQGFLFVKTKNSNQFKPFSEVFEIENKAYFFDGNNAHFTNSRISDIKEDANGGIWIATLNGIYKYQNKKIKKYSHQTSKKNSISSNKVKVIHINKAYNEIWIGTIDGLNKYNHESDNFTRFYEKDGLSNDYVLSIHESDNGYLWLGTESGLTKFDKVDSFEKYTVKNKFINDCFYGILQDKNNNLWLSNNHGLSKFNTKTLQVTNYNIENGLQDYEFNIGAAEKANNGTLFFGGINGINYFYPDSVTKNQVAPKAIITKLQKDSIFLPIDTNTVIKLRKGENLYAYFALPEYSNPKGNSFIYRIIGEDDNWKELNEHFLNLSGRPPGEYTFEVIGINSDGIKNNIPAKVKFEILPTFWQRTLVRSLVIGLPSLAFLLFILYFFRAMKKENRLLQEKQAAHKQVEKQKTALEEKNLSLTDSINYAQRIIKALLPEKKEFYRIFPESFILLKPKDIVSGDFYWFEEEQNNIYLAAIDCTGHGVPGSFMSILGINLFRDIDKSEKDPAKILNKMNKDLKFILQKRSDEVKDGMDLSLCIINKSQKTLNFTGAKNPLYLIRDDELTQFKADRYSIGQADEKKSQFFNSQKFTLRRNDVIYMFSDGYTDQFGGVEGKKFKFRRFRQLLLSIYQKPFIEQKQILDRTIAEWRGEIEQVDDILVMGLRPLSMKAKDSFRTSYDLIDKDKI